MTGSRIMIALLAALALCSTAVVASPTPDRDPGIQDRIAAVVTAVQDEPESIDGRVQDLRVAAGDRRETLLVQLALFLSDSAGTEQAMVGALLVRAFEFSPEEKLTAAVPHLDAESDALRKVLAELLGTVDRPDGESPNFAVYDSWLRQHDRESAAQLIRYMYEVSPGTALAAMTRVYGGEDDPGTHGTDVATLQTLVVEHEGVREWSQSERANAGKILDRLAESDSWWVRLYVAATVQHNPELGTRELRARLDVDPDELVRSMAREAAGTR